MAYAQIRQRVGNRIHHGGKRPRGAAFAGRANAEWMLRCRHLTDLSVEERKVVRARHGIVHERAGQKLPGARIVDAMLQQRLADALNDPAVSLTMNDQWIDGASNIIDRNVARDLNGAG